MLRIRAQSFLPMPEAKCFIFYRLPVTLSKFRKLTNRNMWMKKTVLIFFFELFVCTSTTPDFLDVNLLDEVNTTSTGTQHHDTAPFSRSRIAQAENLQSVCIAWMAMPPYLLDESLPGNEDGSEIFKARKARDVANETVEDNQEEEERKTETNSVRKDPNIKGIFQEIVSKGLQICGRISPKNVSYTIKAKDLQQLDQTIVKREADLFMPVQGNEEDIYGGHTYVEVLKSPGVVFIVNKQQMLELSRKRVLQAMKETWPALVITLSSAGIAGLLIWALDNSRNPEHFPHSFTRGVMEGIWWALVSMTTVGYGDRVPKSLLARLFGILWILSGLLLCSFYTATFTSALTSSSLSHRSSLLGVKVAVMENSPAFAEAMKQAAIVKDYPNFHEMYDALMIKGEVEGILVDMYVASYYMDNISDPRLAVSMFIGTQRSIGFVVGGKNYLTKLHVPCLRSLFKYRQRDIKKIILRHTQAYHTKTQDRRLTYEDADKMVTLLDGDSPGFRIALHILLIPFFLLLSMGFIYDSCISKLRDQRLTTPKGSISDSMDMAATLTSCRPNR